MEPMGIQAYYIANRQRAAIAEIAGLYQVQTGGALSLSEVARFALDHGLGVARQHFAELARKAGEAAASS